MRDPIREEIHLAISRLNIKEERLREVGKHQWEDIIRRVEDTFVSWKGHSSRWYWEHFKDGYAIDYPGYDAHKDLSKLVDRSERVWFLVEEKRQEPKLWVYEGLIQSIQSVIENSSRFEYYLISKKYEWLLCENHHGYLIGCGAKMIGKMERIAGRKDL